MILFIKKHHIFILNLLIVLFLLILPYILFKGKLYVSGDDTRLYYAYPFEYFKEFTFSSWHHFSSVGANGPTQFMIPLLLIWSVLDLIVPSKASLSYLGFSFPLVLGVIFFQLFTNELLKKQRSVEAFLGSVFFISSPILISNQYFIFLSTIWLLPTIPLVSYLFLKFNRTGSFKYVAVAVASCLIFSIGLFSIPWILGYILPFSVPIILYLVFGNIRNKALYLRRSLTFFILLALSQSFWLVSFGMTYFGGSDVNFGSKVLSNEVADTFSPTVLATATGNIVYPLLNLFHRQIAFDFGWDLKNVFESFYDRIVFINFFFVGLLFSGLFLYKKYLEKDEIRVYLIVLCAFMISLFFFTVNIGPLKDIFLLLGNIPGFVMFRNFYDKFALSYIFYYAFLLSISLVILRRFNKRIFVSVVLILLAISILNFSQVGSIINAPLWQTRSIGRNIEIPEEYLEFMSQINKEVLSSENIITIPFGTALYSVIRDVDSNNAYIGTSPVKLFSGVNDFSGFMSFYFSDAKGIIENLIINKEYKDLSEFLRTYNVNYAFVNKNIPQPVLDSWVFDQRMNESQDQGFMDSLFEKPPVIISKNGNYELYRLKESNTILVSDNIYFKRINEFKFRIYIKNLDEKQDLYFNDSFSSSWRLYPIKKPNNDWCNVIWSVDRVRVCKEKKNVYFQAEDLSLFFRGDIFSDTHRPFTEYFTNSWEINGDLFRNELGEEYYTTNEDGSINIELILYFTPQNYFYIGTIISSLTVVGVFFYMWKLKERND